MKLHLTGICGTGMGALAGLLKAAGHDVRGSDARVYPPMSDQLRELGIPVMEGFRGENLDWGPDRVVVGNVCRRDHIEVLAAQARGLELASFPQVLSELFLAGRHSVVVAGTHGKTTTTSLIAWMLLDAGRDPSFLIGGVPQNLHRGYRLGGGEHFAVEGDEYDSAFFDKGSKFLHYLPRTAVLTSVELDHVDIFASFADVQAAFAKLVALVPSDGLLLVAASSEHALEVAGKARCRVETYAAQGRARAGVAPAWQARILDSDASRGRTRFEVTRAGEPFGRFEIGLGGEYNVENALCACAVGAQLGLSPDEIGRALMRFRGVARRQDLRGTAAGVSVIDDYAHHPTAVRETLSALRRRFPRGRLVAVYEPRSATSRRSTFQKEFADAFAAGDEVVVSRLHAPDGIPPAERFDPERLAADLHARGTAARMVPTVDAIVDHVAERVQPGDCVAVFSSGDFEGLVDKILRRLGEPITPARPADMARVREILATVGLPAGDLADDRAGDVLVLSDETGVIGCVAVDTWDDSAVLHSLAVLPERRGDGLGWMLADCAVTRARAQGARRLYLLTATASDFFAEKLGFRAIDAATVDPAISSLPRFRQAGAAAVAMRLDL